MTRLTRDDVIKAIGEADDVAIAEIIGTGATAEELAEAQAWLANDEALINAGRPLPSGRAGRDSRRAGGGGGGREGRFSCR